MTRHPGTLRTRLLDDAGSVASWFIVTAGLLAFLVGMAVDVSGKVSARSHAYMIAAEAARTGGQQIAAGSAMDGDVIAVDPLVAADAARDYLAAAGVPGTVTITGGGTTLDVTTETTYEPRFLGAFGVGPLEVGGHAQARLARVLQGSEQ
jgi:hypothetical protein